ncbi:hypothetical protein [Methylicorpusculum sp.]|uniref:hypothetical protein n=1 Tax=Methylicorpusculum sp. TaxID=2713644 RepID=UPI0027321C18|nr:hypothetical protein [Methylicorpusculum sp.]
MTPLQRHSFYHRDFGGKGYVEILSNSPFDLFGVVLGWEKPFEERRKRFHVGLAAASDRQGRWKCRFCPE